MAAWGRAHLIKASLLAGILLLLLNFYNYRLDNAKQASDSSASVTSSMGHNSPIQWPKRTRSSAEASIKVHHPTHIRNNKTADTTVASSNPSRANETIPAAVASSPLPDISPLASLATPQPPAGDIQPTDVILANLTNLNVSHQFRKGEQNATSAKMVTAMTNETNNSESFESGKMHQIILGTLSPNTCPPIPPNLEGRITVLTTVQPMDVLEQRFVDKLLPGGWYRPPECVPRDRVAIVIPYRDRATHLPVLLANLHPMLMRQQIEYGIFLVEQSAAGLFNRAALMNIGFVEALRLADWDCFIFHDIDLLPLDDRNLYTCPDQPRHMSVAVDKLGFKLPYKSLFGGVSALTVKQFRTVNGFSNSFWGWGGEDDDMSNRLKHVGFHIARYPVNIARYMMLEHLKEKANPKRYENLVNGAKKYDVDGLNSLHYKLEYLEKKILYTWIVVKIEPEAAR